jgi:hypothetical protein
LKRVSPGRLVRLALLVAAIMLSSAIGGPARAQSPAPAAPASTTDARKDEARVHFERGAALVRDQAWEAALAEFLLSRELYATRGNTQNAAVCLRQLRRYDEALTMLETLLARFPSVSPADRAAADDEIKQLRALVGTVLVRASESGARIQIDDRERPDASLGPTRLSAGSHVVRVYKAGFLPFTSRVEIAGGQGLTLDARLEPLRESGRLRVVEPTGRPADVLVDGIAVGPAPWEGALPPGPHSVALRGDEGLGTQPARVEVRIDAVTPLSLALEALDADLRIEPVPAGASVALDGVPVGNGIWSGRVKSGGHLVEAGAPGFLPRSRSVLLATGQSERLIVTLDRDPESPLWGGGRRGRFVFDVGVGLATGSRFGGDVSSACTGSCSTALPLGGAAMLHAGYELSFGLGFALSAGYLATFQKIEGRTVDATPRGRPTISGTADDALALRGLLLGGSIAYHQKTSLPLHLRLGAGALLGEVRDERTGTFALGRATGTETTAARYAYVAPEVRLGHRLGDHVEISAGVQAIVLVALSQPAWRDHDNVVLGRDFLLFGEQTTAGSLVVVLIPGLGLRYEL